jgi:hypothetical protein
LLTGKDPIVTNRIKQLESVETAGEEYDSMKVMKGTAFTENRKPRAVAPSGHRKTAADRDQALIAIEIENFTTHGLVGHELLQRGA